MTLIDVLVGGLENGNRLIQAVTWVNLGVFSSSEAFLGAWQGREKGVAVEFTLLPWAHVDAWNVDDERSALVVRYRGKKGGGTPDHTFRRAKRHPVGERNFCSTRR